MAYVHVPIWGWVAVAGGLAVLLCVDLLASSRRNRPVRMAEAAGWTLIAVLLAVGFGALLAATSGGTPAGQFFAGWLTEYSLSLDNLLVFVILISRSPVPARLRPGALRRAGPPGPPYREEIPRTGTRASRTGARPPRRAR